MGVALCLLIGFIGGMCVRAFVKPSPRLHASIQVHAGFEDYLLAGIVGALCVIGAFEVWNLLMMTRGHVKFE